MFVEALKFSTGALLLVCLVSSAPTRTHYQDAVERQQKLANIQRLGSEIERLTASGKLYDAVRLEQTMENEILKSTLDELFKSPDARDGKFLKQLVRTDSRAVDTIADQLNHGSDAELNAVRDALKRDKRAPQLLNGVLSSSSGGGGSSDGSSSDDGGSGSLGIVSSLLGASSGKSNRLTRSVETGGNSTKQVSEKTKRIGLAEVAEAIDIANEILDEKNHTQKAELIGLVGGVTVQNSAGNDSAKDVKEGSGLIGGVTIPAKENSGIIGGVVILNKNESSGGGSVGGGLIGGVTQKQPVTGLVGGTAVANADDGAKMPAALPSGATGLVGGVSFTEKPDGDAGYNYEKPQESLPNTALKPPAAQNDFFGVDPGSLNNGVITGVIRPVKQTDGEESSDDSSGGGDGGSSGSILALIGPLSGASSGGGGDEGGGGSDIFGALAGLIGPLSSSSSGGGGEDGGGGSDIFGALAGLLGPLSSSSSGGGGDSEGGGGSDIFGALAGLSGPLSSSSSGGGGTDGQGGSGGGLLSGLLGSSSGGGGTGDGSDGGGGSNVGSLLSSALGASSGGGGTLDLTGGAGGDGNDDDDDDDDDEPAGTGSNAVNLISGLLGSSSGGGDGDGNGGGSNVIGLLSSLLGASSSNGGGSSFGSGGGGDGSSGGGSGGILSSLLGASSGGGDGQGTDGGGSLIGTVLSSSSGGDGSGGANDFQGQLLSTLFRIKFAIFRSLLSLLTGLLGSSSGSG